MNNAGGVSIQLKLGGHSLSVADTLATLPQEVAHCCVVVNSHKATLVPAELFEERHAERLLNLAGKYLDESEVVVCSEVQGDIVAVMAVPAEAHKALSACNALQVTYTTPLLDMRHGDQTCTSLLVEDGVAYIHHFDGGMQRAVAVSVSTPDDTLYYIIELRQGLSVAEQVPLYVTAPDNHTKLLKQYIRRVICE